jgi:hypothetical protein
MIGEIKIPEGKKTVRVDHQTVLVVDQDKNDIEVIEKFMAKRRKKSTEFGYFSYR